MQVDQDFGTPRMSVLHLNVDSRNWGSWGNEMHLRSSFDPFATRALVPEVVVDLDHDICQKCNWT